jgi:hypothetical protein
MLIFALHIIAKNPAEYILQIHSFFIGGSHSHFFLLFIFNYKFYSESYQDYIANHNGTNTPDAFNISHNPAFPGVPTNANAAGNHVQP